MRSAASERFSAGIAADSRRSTAIAGDYGRPRTPAPRGSLGILVDGGGRATEWIRIVFAAAFVLQGVLALIVDAGHAAFAIATVAALVCLLPASGPTPD